ncbi:MAG TPA: sigma-70 family RNA polymerase sigma factor [Pirellulales bacterium]|nr:sigma-70 family RNA polymerase sigma factor [Pirellulales bacterium]
MPTTPVSLLNRLKSAKPDAIEWTRFEEIYRPLIRYWLGRVLGLGDEASDVAQDVFSVLIRELPRFDRRREGSFRAWLQKVTINRTRAFLKRRRRQPQGGTPAAAEGFLEQLEDPNSDLSGEWNRQHDQHVFQRLLASIVDDFTPTTLAAFQRCGIEGLPAAAVAAELGISENAVLLAKSRILKRLRDEAAGLID